MALIGATMVEGLGFWAILLGALPGRKPWGLGTLTAVSGLPACGFFGPAT